MSAVWLKNDYVKATLVRRVEQIIDQQARAPIFVRALEAERSIGDA
jgi:hypothetical protein